MLLDEEAPSVSMGMPPMLIGSDMRGAEYESFEVGYSSGRALTAEDRGVVVVGADLVGKLGAEVGKTVTVRGRDLRSGGHHGEDAHGPGFVGDDVTPRLARAVREQSA